MSDSRKVCMQLFPAGVLYDGIDSICVDAGVFGRVGGDTGVPNHFGEG